MGNDTTTQKGEPRSFAGEVVSVRMDKTAVVRVDRVVAHPKYGKRVKLSRKFLVHDEKNEAQVGDKVAFVECRPVSKQKRWRLTQKLS